MGRTTLIWRAASQKREHISLNGQIQNVNTKTTDMETVDDCRQTVVSFVGTIKGNPGLRPCVDACFVDLYEANQREPIWPLKKPSYLVVYGTTTLAIQANKIVF